MKHVCISLSGLVLIATGMVATAAPVDSNQAPSSQAVPGNYGDANMPHRDAAPDATRPCPAHAADRPHPAPSHPRKAAAATSPHHPTHAHAAAHHPAPAHPAQARPCR